MSREGSTRHLIAGGVGGTMGAVVTCPLEVLKTRLQSSSTVLRQPVFQHSGVLCTPEVAMRGSGHTVTTAQLVTHNSRCTQHTSRNILHCFRYILATEGTKGLFKGLSANLAGVAPSRAVYFYTYGSMKKFLNERMHPETPAVHVCSAVTASVTTSTLTNPIWFLKTRLQLDESRKGALTCAQVVRRVYRQYGVRGFYKGITASYVGSIETVIHFVIYEALKAKVLAESRDCRSSDFARFMLCAALSKTVASVLAYPHEVVRTRLRQEGRRYHGFLQTISLVAREEGWGALYRGLYVQMFRQIPNAAIMMVTYELVLHWFSKQRNVM